MDNQPDAKEQANGGQNSNTKTVKPRQKLWRRFIRYQMRLAHQRKTERKKNKAADSVTDGAARSTAKATWWIAAFTIVLAIVAGLTLYVVIEGGTDTHELAVAAGKQAESIKAILQYYVRVERGKQARVETGTFGIYHKGSQIEASLIPQNYGELEAKELKYVMNLDFAASAPKHRNFTNKDFANLAVILAPGDKSKRSMTRFVEATSDEKRPNLYVSGEIRYADLAGDSTPFSFCYWTTIKQIMVLPDHTVGDIPAPASPCDQPEE